MLIFKVPTSIVVLTDSVVALTDSIVVLTNSIVVLMKSIVVLTDSIEVLINRSAGGVDLADAGCAARGHREGRCRKRQPGSAGRLRRDGCRALRRAITGTKLPRKRF